MKQDDRTDLIECILNALQGKVCRIVQYGHSTKVQDTVRQSFDISVFTPYRINVDEEERLSNAVFQFNRNHSCKVSVIDLPERTFLEKVDSTPFYQKMEREGVLLWQPPEN